MIKKRYDMPKSTIFTCNSVNYLVKCRCQTSQYFSPTESRCFCFCKNTGSVFTCFRLEHVTCLATAESGVFRCAAAAAHFFILF